MNMQSHADVHTTAHLSAPFAPLNAHVDAPSFYSSTELAEELGVSESTIRTRWFDWLTKVVPQTLLKESQGYTDLARTLFQEFSAVEKRDRQQWVMEAKARYAEEWRSLGVIEGELMPQSVGGALATIQSSNVDAAIALAEEMEAALTFGNQLGEIEEEFSHSEIEAMRLRGARRGILQFKVEAQAAADTYNQLRQKGLK
ncbi:MAG: hypothetical protein AAF327_09830 [Cyanobacteria bacterium P01_A01_bin.37]